MLPSLTVGCEYSWSASSHLVEHAAGCHHLFVVGGDHDRTPRLRPLEERVDHALSVVAVEGRRRFVDEEHGSALVDRAGDGEPPLLASAQMCGALVAAARESYPSESILEPRPVPDDPTREEREAVMVTL